MIVFKAPIRCYTVYEAGTADTKQVLPKYYQIFVLDSYQTRTTKPKGTQILFADTKQVLTKTSVVRMWYK
jgi:hypothetical protein